MKKLSLEWLVLKGDLETSCQKKLLKRFRTLRIFTCIKRMLKIVGVKSCYMRDLNIDTQIYKNAMFNVQRKRRI